MPGPLEKLFKQGLVYGGATLLQKALGFALLPLYTSVLTPADYGTIELLDLLVTVLSLGAGLGLIDSIARFYQQADDDRARSAVVSTLSWGVLGGAVVICLALFVAAPFAGPVFLTKLPQASRLIRLVAAQLFFALLAELGLAVLRSEQRSGLFAAAQLGRVLLGLVLNIVLIVDFRMGVEGTQWSALISGAAIGLPLAVRTALRYGVALDLTRLRAMLRFGLPYVPASAGAFVQNFADRFFLRAFTSLSDVGAYAIGYRFGMLIPVFVTGPFFRSFGVQRFEVARSDPAGAPRFMARAATYLWLGLVTFVLLLSAFADDLVRVMSSNSGLYPGAAVVPIVACAYGVKGLHFCFDIGPQLANRTGLIAWNNAATAGVNIGLNFLFIRPYGMMGAAIATLLTFVFQFSLMYAMNQRLYPIPVEWKRLAKIAVAAGIAYAAAVRLGSQAGDLSTLSLAARVWAVAPDLVWRSLALLLFPAGLQVLGFLEREERAAVVGVLARFVPARLRPAPATLVREEAAAP